MTQRDEILALLRRAGTAGVNSYGIGRKIALQLPTRIFELRQQGYTIVKRQHKTGYLKGSVDYILVSEPKALAAGEAPALQPQQLGLLGKEVSAS